MKPSAPKRLAWLPWALLVLTLLLFWGVPAIWKTQNIEVRYEPASKE